MNILKIEISDKNCSIIENGDKGPIFLWGMYPHRGNEVEHLAECLESIGAQHSFTIIAYQAENWDDDFSPWKADGIYDNRAFSGNGFNTLNWLQSACLEYIRQNYRTGRPLIPMGYSLAGLFSLWCTYESDLFNGAISCSGSLWFPGWTQYVENKYVASKGTYYLSLGGKEEKTDNAIVATVGKCHREQASRLKSDENVINSIFELNSGGHFADSGKRLTKGITWILNQNN